MNQFQLNGNTLNGGDLPVITLGGRTLSVTTDVRTLVILQDACKDLEIEADRRTTVIPDDIRKLLI